MTQNKFAEVMAKRSYAGLHEIVGKLREEYEPDAVVAAEAEVEKRNLGGEKIAPEENITRTKRQQISEKANAPLQIQWKILTLLLPGLLNLLIADELKADGYNRQYEEIWRWFFYGLGFYILLFLIVIALAFILT